MELMKQIWESAKNNTKKIVLPEGDEERTLIASQKIKEEGLADIYLVGSEKVIREKAEKLGVNLDGINVVDPETSDNLDKYVNEFYSFLSYYFF